VSLVIGIDPGLTGALAVLDHAGVALLYPTADLRLAKNDGRAEALLLAHWSLSRSTPVAA